MKRCNIPNLGGECVYEEFEPISEQWNSYRLKDGTTVMVKIVVSSIIRTSLKGPDSQNMFFLKTQNVIDSLPPDAIDLEKVN